MNCGAAFESAPQSRRAASLGRHGCSGGSSGERRDGANPKGPPLVWEDRVVSGGTERIRRVLRDVPVNVLLFSGPDASEREQEVHAELNGLLEADPRFVHAAVSLPRAEAMLMPRLIGLWDVLVFVGGSHSESPMDPNVLDRQVELLDMLPPVLMLGHPADLWPRWSSFQSLLYRTGSDQRAVDCASPDAGQRALDALATFIVSASSATDEAGVAQ